MDYLNAFLCGGLLCAIGQILIDKTPLTPARILTGYVVCGVLLTAIGVYEPIVKWGGAGATVPLLGFGYSLAKGVEKVLYAFTFPLFMLTYVPICIASLFTKVEWKPICHTRVMTLEQIEEPGLRAS